MLYVKLFAKTKQICYWYFFEKIKNQNHVRCDESTIYFLLQYLSI